MEESLSGRLLAGGEGKSVIVRKSGEPKWMEPSSTARHKRGKWRGLYGGGPSHPHITGDGLTNTIKPVCVALLGCPHVVVASVAMDSHKACST